MCDEMNDSGVVWTGHNVKEVEEYAINNRFGFVVGSSYHNSKLWYVRAVNWIGRRLPFGLSLEWQLEDKSVLEIYPVHEDSNGKPKSIPEEIVTNFTNDLNDMFRPIDQAEALVMLQEFLNDLHKYEGENTEYIPWHWTTAKPGDTIFHNGKVKRLIDGRRL